MMYKGQNVLYFTAAQSITLECGAELRNPQIAYHTYGTLNAAGDNVIWICHALTANSDPADWWSGLVGEGLVFDTSQYFVVCANVIGSCYGSVGPLSVNPAENRPYYRDFPEITIRDMVAAHELLREHLGVRKIKIVAGGSTGAFQALEWCVVSPDLIETLVFTAAGACAVPWVIAHNEAQRMAIEADHTFFGDTPDGGRQGLAAARAMALTTYRTYAAYNATQADLTDHLPHIRRACSYQRYQGEKLIKRFNAYSYYRLTQAVDSHDISRNRGGDVSKILRGITIPSLIIGISTDTLYPVCEQIWMAKQMPNAVYKEVVSQFGHDGFLIEFSQLTLIIQAFLERNVKKY